MKKGLIWGLVAFGVVATGSVLYFTVFKKKTSSSLLPKEDVDKLIAEANIKTSVFKGLNYNSFVNKYFK